MKKFLSVPVKAVVLRIIQRAFNKGSVVNDFISNIIYFLLDISF